MKFFIVGVFLFSVQVSQAFTIQQILSKQNKAAVLPGEGESAAVGEVLLATRDSKNCSMKVESVQQKFIIVNTKGCHFRDELRIGDKLEKSIIPVEDSETLDQAQDGDLQSNPKSKPSLEETPERNIWYSLSLYYSGADKLEFKEMKVSTATASGTGSGEFGTEGALGVGFSVGQLPQNSWGVLGHFSLEGTRRLKTFTARGNNGTAVVACASDCPKLTYLVLEGNLVYRWNSFYLPFGLNYGVPGLSESTTTTLEYSGGFGINFGAGYFLSDHFSLEMHMRGLGMKLKLKQGTDTIDFGNGTLVGIAIGGKFWF